MKLKRNRAKCLKCGDVIESLTRHDFISCVCEAIFVDGGTDYQRAGATSWEIFKDMSEYEEDPRDEALS